MSHAALHDRLNHYSTSFHTQPVALYKCVRADGNVQDSLPILSQIHNDVQRQGVLPVPESPRYNSSSQKWSLRQIRGGSDFQLTILNLRAVQIRISRYC